MKKLLLMGVLVVALAACNSKTDPYYISAGSIESTGMLGTKFITHDGTTLQPTNGYQFKIGDGLNRQYAYVGYTVPEGTVLDPVTKVLPINVTEALNITTKETLDGGAIYNDPLFKISSDNQGTFGFSFITYNNYIATNFMVKVGTDIMNKPDELKKLKFDLEGIGVSSNGDTLKFAFRHDNNKLGTGSYVNAQNEIAFDIKDYVYNEGYNDKARYVSVAVTYIGEAGDTLVKAVTFNDINGKPVKYDPNKPFADSSK